MFTSPLSLIFGWAFPETADIIQINYYMGFSLLSILESICLLANAVAILNDRFLKPSKCTRS
jgi:hypothetical protein